MKYKVLITLLLSVTLILFSHYGFDLMNQPNDICFLLGVVVEFSIVIIFIKLLNYVWKKKTKKEEKNEKSNS